MLATVSQTLSWSHFIELVSIEDPTKRLFYQQMSIVEHWSIRTLRQKMNYNQNFMNIYDKNAIEFATVAAEMCHFLESSNQLDKQDFLNRALKMLPLLYLKALLAEKPEDIGEDNLEDFVTEDAYEYIRQSVAAILEADDRYLEVFSPEMQYSDTPLATDISEDLADIYQDLKNFLERFQIGLEEIMNDALRACLIAFEEYWGQRLVNCLRALHNVYFNPDTEERITNEESLDDKSFRDSFLSHQL